MSFMLCVIIPSVQMLMILCCYNVGVLLDPGDQSLSYKPLFAPLKT